MPNRKSLTRREALGVIGAGGPAWFARPAAAKTSGFPKGAIIRTILRDLPPEVLSGGARPPAPPVTPPGQPYFMQDLDLMVEEIKTAGQEGVACIVDGGHENMGRDLNFLKRISMQSGMPIVAGCGYYAQPFDQPEVAGMSEDRLARELVRNVKTQSVGVFGEIGAWDEMTAGERRVFSAIGRAHVATNLPIFTHTNPGKGALEQLDLLESMGVKPQHVAIGHIGGLQDPKAEAVKALCKRGAFVGYDRQGEPGDARNIPQVLALIEAGYADNLLFASDFSIAQQLKRNGGPGYARTVTVFVPRLREAGVKEEVLHSILVDNPRRFLAFVPKKPRKA